LHYHRAVPRIAWFSPMPPARTGIAAYSAEALSLLAHDLEIDVYDEPRAHDFVWKQTKQPYDLIVYQIGNSRGHAYQWAYLTRYPGLTVLHDAQLHQARALHLLLHHREQDYRAELRFSHPDAPDGVADFIAAGLGGSLYYLWPMLRLVVEASRSIAVHDERLADDLRKAFPAAHVDVIPMGVGPVAPGDTGAEVRARHGIPSNALVFGTYGTVTAAKRVEPILRALARVSLQHPHAHLLITGEPSADLDVERAALEIGVADRVTLAGYVADEHLDGYLQAADACLCLRWPSTGETSASWLRCLAAGKPTITTNLVQMEPVPRLDARDGHRVGCVWPDDVEHGAPEPVTIAVDVLDEDRTLELAMARLASDARLRATLGATARDYWKSRHTLEQMARHYREVIQKTLGRNDREPAVSLDGLPHLRADGTALAKRVTATLGVPYPF
jgi:glycosyltransferase involved in cell wall biosynthesis